MPAFPLNNIARFCSGLQIPAKDHAGLFRMTTLYSTQMYFLRELAAGFEDGVHDFLVLKGRQQGITTITDALDLYWPQRFEGIQGLMVADDDDNKEVRRDILRTMYYALDEEFKRPIRADNDKMLAWGNGSRLMFAAAATRTQGQKTKLGRGRGVSYVHADEFDAWTNERAVMGLRASRSTRHPRRLYTWASTAQGHGVLYQTWKAQEHSPTTRRIFIPAWRHTLNHVERDNRTIWDVYGSDRLTEDEKLWIRAVKERYDYDIPPEYVVWYRWQLVDAMKNDEAMMAQEHPNLEEDAFQAMGDRFFRPALIRALREKTHAAPEPHGYRFEWDRFIDTSKLVPCEAKGDGVLTVWEEPDPEGVYIVSCHPAHSSSPTATDDVIQIWRAYPDQLVQAAEYIFEGGDLTVHCAWASMILAGDYRMNRRFADVYFIMDIQMTGIAVYQEISRIESRAASFSPRTPQGKRDLQDVQGALRHYFFRRPDSFTATGVIEWKSQPDFRPWVLNQLRDAVENGMVDVRSESLVDELAGVRRGEVDADTITAGGATSECRVIATAMATEHYLNTVIPEIEGRFATRKKPESNRHVGEVMVGAFLQRVAKTGRGR
jgi:hypothetical protein